jgi:hypothetical protein
MATEKPYQVAIGSALSALVAHSGVVYEQDNKLSVAYGNLTALLIEGYQRTRGAGFPS